MTVSPERLAAFADGELDERDAREVQAELDRSPDLRAQLEAHRRLRARLGDHFAPIAAQPVPDRLIETICSRPHAEVVDIAAARVRRAPAHASPGLGWIVGPALAASVVLALVLFQPLGDSSYASGELAGALDRQLAASQRAEAPVRVLLSFRNDAGQYCRAYSARNEAGVACRTGGGWKVVERAAGGTTQTTEYRQAGSAVAEIMAASQEIAAGPALSAEEEARARASGWRAE